MVAEAMPWCAPDRIPRTRARRVGSLSTLADWIASRSELLWPNPFFSRWIEPVRLEFNCFRNSRWHDPRYGDLAPSQDPLACEAGDTSRL